MNSFDLIEKYNRILYRIEIIPDNLESGYGARCPELPGCITCGDSLEETINNIKDAKRSWIAAALEDNIQIPIPSDEDMFRNRKNNRILIYYIRLSSMEKKKKNNDGNCGPIRRQSGALAKDFVSISPDFDDCLDGWEDYL